jgi:crotonobetainyl-CoA:carnitine CoA-transferase CaiB-like acyl-CoA transferase
VSRIIDLGGLAGAYAARLLAEAGHDIIRIDSANGDRVRRTGPFLGDKPGLESGSFHQFLNAACA